eukprot:1105927-Alexandrium_andersonii.AAC.1
MCARASVGGCSQGLGFRAPCEAQQLRSSPLGPEGPQRLPWTRTFRPVGLLGSHPPPNGSWTST